MAASTADQSADSRVETMVGPLETLDAMMVDYLAVKLVDPSAVLKADQMVDWKVELSAVLLADEMVDKWVG